MSFISSALIIAGIGGVLAALIVIIDGLVNNYGQLKISINQGQKELSVKGGAPLLITLSEQEIFIPSACGGRGSCGACKVKVKTDIGPVFPTEIPYMSQEELAVQTRLSCQVKVKQDLEIEIPEELFYVKEYQATVRWIKDVTHDIKEVRFHLDKPDSITFKSGQYAQLEIPPYGKVSDPTQRAYSIQSVPSVKDEVELLIRLVPGGIVTSYVHQFLKEGQKVKLIGPFGDFHLHDTDAIILGVAGGSGMAPLKSILMDMFEKGITGREVWYFFGALGKKDLFYLEEMQQLEKQWPNFHFIPALSRPDEGDNWKGETGLITEVLDRYLKTRISTEKPKEGYLCGSPGMIDACVKVMTNNAVSPDRIFYDKFA